MKIGVFTEVYRPIINGVVASVESLTEELRVRGHEAYTFAPRIPNGVEALGRVFFMPSLPLPARTEYRLTVPLVARRNKARFLSQCDIIHAHSLFVTGWMAQYYARYRFRVPLVFTYHTMLERYAHYSPLGQRITAQLTRELTRAYSNAADAVIAPTQAVASKLRDVGVVAPICVVPTGIELDRFRNAGMEQGQAARARFDIPNGAPLLLLVSRLAQEKSVSLALEALRLLRSDLPDARLLLVGAGPSADDLRAQAAASGLGDAAIFAGAVPRDELPAIYAAADLFVFPSTSETQGLVLAEAFAAGLPVVAAASPQTRDVFGPNQAGELVEDGPGMAQAVGALLGDRARYGAASAHARTAAAAFDIKATAGRVIAVYEAVMANRAGTAAMGDFEDLFDLVG
ncbi:MAG TPA: glycosyltransferase [Candidatus Eremiobacteraceae bacterium]|nr:glycosyltransferase [Candidatus Eremiobacteraceae bacterium]